MSQQNVDAYKLAVDAFNRRDFEEAIEYLDTEVEWRPALLASLEAEATVYRGHDGVREWVRTVQESFSEFDIEIEEIRDLGDRLLSIGRIRMRGEVSGAETESPVAYVIEYRDGLATKVQSYLDPDDALEAAGLRP